MLNHVRTLLRNADPEPYAGEDGQEIVDPGFRPVPLPAHLATVHAVLFGRRPDRAGLDLKLRRYMAALHSTGLASYVTAVDPRITYRAPEASRLEFDFRPSVAPSGHDATLYLAGDPPSEDGGGALAYAWTVAVAPGAAVVVRIRPDSASASVPVSYASGLGSPVPLAGSGLSARFHSGLPEGTSWLVSCTARPSGGLGQVVASLGEVGEDAMVRLFGVYPGEPYRTWKALWYSDADLPYRLGSVLLALAYRVDELRKVR